MSEIHVHYLDGLLDIANPQEEVEVQIDYGQPEGVGIVVRVNVDGICRLRICRIPDSCLKVVHMNPYSTKEARRDHDHNRANVHSNVPAEGTGIHNQGVAGTERRAEEGTEGGGV